MDQVLSLFGGGSRTELSSVQPASRLGGEKSKDHRSTADHVSVNSRTILLTPGGTYSIVDAPSRREEISRRMQSTKLEGSETKYNLEGVVPIRIASGRKNGTIIMKKKKVPSIPQVRLSQSAKERLAELEEIWNAGSSFGDVKDYLIELLFKEGNSFYDKDEHSEETVSQNELSSKLPKGILKKGQGEQGKSREGILTQKIMEESSSDEEEFLSPIPSRGPKNLTSVHKTDFSHKTEFSQKQQTDIKKDEEKAERQKEEQKEEEKEEEEKEEQKGEKEEEQKGEKEEEQKGEKEEEQKGEKEEEQKGEKEEEQKGEKEEEQKEEEVDEKVPDDNDILEETLPREKTPSREKTPPCERTSPHVKEEEQEANETTVNEGEEDKVEEKEEDKLEEKEEERTKSAEQQSTRIIKRKSNKKR